MRVLIVDCYIDEPAVFGVPPYISPYHRYLAGAALAAGADVSYLTIDQVRRGKTIKADLTVFCGGISVPGKYIGGVPPTVEELLSVASRFSSPKILTGPLARYGGGFEGGTKSQKVTEGFDLIVPGDGEIVLYNILKGTPLDKVNIHEHLPRSQVRKFAELGASVVTQHPNFPHYIIAEIETYRGCHKWRRGCSFCTEPAKGAPDMREPEDIVAEVAALYKAGVRAFRLGAQPCLISYMADINEIIPRPVPEALERLYKGIWAVAPDLKVLHMDNMSPSVLTQWPEESREALKVIVKYNTTGDIAALGIESADPRVVDLNSLKTHAEDSKRAIALVNEVGAIRVDGVPKLLPGLNFVFGLPGETKETYKLNYEFLADVSQKYLFRRVNLRQVLISPRTKLQNFETKVMDRHKSLFHSFKLKVRENIDRPMLRKLFLQGTVLKNVYAETREPSLTLCRQLGSYSMLVGVPAEMELGKYYNLAVVDYGYRSLTAVPYPLDLKTAPRKFLEIIPGVGRKTVASLLRLRDAALLPVEVRQYFT